MSLSIGGPRVVPIRVYDKDVPGADGNTPLPVQVTEPEVVLPPQDPVVTDEDSEPSVPVGESFRTVFAEFTANVPDRTTTIEEKELAIQYIDRLLACPDIPNPEYWEAKKIEIQREIDAIKQMNADNDSQTNSSGEKIADVWAEFCEFVDANRPADNSDLYACQAYSRTCLEYLERLLACSDIDDPQNAKAKQDYLEQKAWHEQVLTDIDRALAERKENEDNFDFVLPEMIANVPQVTTTLEEKELAISYIDKLLACENNPDPEYWQNLKSILEQEIVEIKNRDKIGNGQNFATILHEFSQYTSKYSRSSDSFANENQKDMYQYSYHSTCVSFYQRLLASSDATPELIATWQEEMKVHQQALAELEKAHEESVNSESYYSVLVELRTTLRGDGTTTMEEKQLALQYIDRLLACPDIPNPEYWENKKAIIEQEIVIIENSEKVGNGQSEQEIWAELHAFQELYGVERDFSSPDSKAELQNVQYMKTYYMACITFYNRLQYAPDATEESITRAQIEMQRLTEAVKDLDELLK